MAAASTTAATATAAPPRGDPRAAATAALLYERGAQAHAREGELCGLRAVQGLLGAEAKANNVGGEEKEKRLSSYF